MRSSSHFTVIIFIIYIFSVYAYYAHKVKCNACLDRSFLEYKDYYQNHKYRRMIGLPLALQDYSCAYERFQIVPCNHSCLKIDIHRPIRGKMNIIGSLMDCSTEILEQNYRINNELDLKNFTGNFTFDDWMGPELRIAYAFNERGDFPAPQLNDTPSSHFYGFILIVSFLTGVLFMPMYRCLMECCLSSSNFDTYSDTSVHFTSYTRRNNENEENAEPKTISNNENSV